jgi:hypothetical protein
MKSLQNCPPKLSLVSLLSGKMALRLKALVFSEKKEGKKD